MRHWLFILAVSLSLLLVIAVVIAWVRSYFIQDVWLRHAALPPGQRVVGFQEIPGALEREVRKVSLQRGAVVFHRAWAEPTPKNGRWYYERAPLLGWEHMSGYPPQRVEDFSWVAANFAGHSFVHLLGVQWADYSATPPGVTSRPPMKFTTVVVPLWMPLLISGILPALWILTRRRRLARVARGRCLACGYDLTGNTSGVCPECGMAASSWQQDL